MNYVLSYTLKHRILADTFSEHYIIYAEDEFDEPMNSCLKEYERLVEEDGKDFVEWYLFHAIISTSIKSTDLY
jgi:succinate dehydrogenase flavin-adding protein (antitoxin of CptAB toxin-antitoxin module)